MSDYKQKVLIFIISYNHENLLMQTLDRIPESLHTDYPDVKFDILIIDDCSKDKTFANGYDFLKTYKKFDTLLLSNPVNQQFGGNQKIGYEYAMEKGYDHVVLLHGDGQYAPEMIPTLVKPLIEGEADAVFGSRMLDKGGARKGGMPLYKYIGNKILTGLENRLVGANLSEWHSGFRLYSVKALRKMPFQYNSNYYDFDTQIIIQLVGQGLRVKEIPIPTHYGDEECNVDGLKYARMIIWECLQFKVQDWGIFYHPSLYLKERFKEKPDRTTFDTSLSRLALKAKEAQGKSLIVINDDEDEIRDYFEKEVSNSFVVCVSDIEKVLQENGEKFDNVFFIDSFEAVNNIEKTLEDIRNSKRTAGATCHMVVANVGFILTRLMLLFGRFSYGARGILDFRHKRLYTKNSAKALLQSFGYKINDTKTISVPWSLVFKCKFFVGFISLIWKILLKLSKGLFAYQFYFEFTALPSLNELLRKTQKNTEEKIEGLKS